MESKSDRIIAKRWMERGVGTRREKEERPPPQSETEGTERAEVEAFRSACRHYARRAAHLRR
jgi:hypothetical protein